MLRMIALVRADRSWIRVSVAVILSPGMSTSSTTMSGVVAATYATACSLFPASPTTTMSFSASRIPRNPSRSSAWSSTISTRIGRPGGKWSDSRGNGSASLRIAGSYQRNARLDRGLPAGDAESVAQAGEQGDCHPQGDPAQAGGARLVGYETDAVDLDRGAQLVRSDLDAYHDPGRLAVHERVAQRLPQYQEQLVEDGGLDPGLVAVDPYDGLHPRRLQALDAAQQRLFQPFGLGVQVQVLGELADVLQHLAQGRAGLAQPLLGEDRVGVQLELDQLDGTGGGAHPGAEPVVHLARDPAPLADMRLGGAVEQEAGVRGGGHPDPVHQAGVQRPPGHGCEQRRVRLVGDRLAYPGQDDLEQQRTGAERLDRVDAAGRAVPADVGREGEVRRVGGRGAGSKQDRHIA